MRYTEIDQELISVCTLVFDLAQLRAKTSEVFCIITRHVVRSNCYRSFFSVGQQLYNTLHHITLRQT